MWGPYYYPRMEKKLGQGLLWGSHVDTGHWQAISGVPQTRTIELQNVLVEVGIPQRVDILQELIKPNLPWAEDHFQERVSGEPLNPGVQYQNWPWYRGNVETHKQPGQFSHSYMERFWPRTAGQGDPRREKTHWDNQGIRYRYGDLNDVVALLAREPYTRQAVLPVFFPEDTGAHHGERIPCTLYYHFLLRDGRLHCNYTIRSCDFLRHFKDDVYMAARLCQWVLEQLQIRQEPLEERYATPQEETWANAVPGKLTMLMHSLHVFEGDLPKMRREYG